MGDLEFCIGLIEGLVRGGKTPNDARKQLERGNMVEPDLLLHAQRSFEEKTGRIRSLREPGGIQDELLLKAPWYAGPTADDVFWPMLEAHLRKRGWTTEIEALDKASTRIVSLLQPPGSDTIRTRGLVVGYVQSGKTSNFTAVISKAADAGYKLFIVLSGLHNGLRTQTQRRLEREIRDLNARHWVTLTTTQNDFIGLPSQAAVFLTDPTHQKILCVVKKNATVLRKLTRWLTTANKEVLSNCPVLVIDDEADQASLNAGGLDEEKRTAINRLILELLDKLPKAAYVGYTATPFANVLTDPRPTDLYPRDFIVSLPQPPNYFGPERIFGRERLDLDSPGTAHDGLDLIRYVADTEVEALKPRPNEYRTFMPGVTASLGRALRYFWLATAARRARGQAAQHSSMLVHTTFYADVHERFREPIDRVRKGLAAKVAAKDAATLADLRSLWDEECARVPAASVGATPTSFDELAPHLHDVISSTELVVENGRSQIRLEYDDDDPAIVIVIGGNTLARGLTLEGLVVSLFVRAASAYDTLLQMGRWFGYRPGYADLPRIWLTKELEGWFYDLATVEQEIRNDIKRYEEEKLRPNEFGVRIRTHPALEITARLKMQHSVTCSMSFSETTRQTILFRHRDVAWLRGNLAATREFLETIKRGGARAERDAVWRTCFREVPADAVLAFLGRYAFHEDATEVRRDLLTRYIEGEARHGELASWNVAVVGLESPKPETRMLELAEGVSVPLLTRSRLVVGVQQDDRVSLGAIMSPIDAGADLGLDRSALTRMSNAQLLIKRPKGVGLLLIYAIDRHSKPVTSMAAAAPRTSERFRAPLDAAEDIIGLGFAFPRSSRPTAVEYVTVDLSSIPREPLPATDEEEDVSGVAK